jgi:hypothetical protein
LPMSSSRMAPMSITCSSKTVGAGAHLNQHPLLRGNVIGLT